MAGRPQQPGSSWPPTRPPYPTLSTPNGASAFPPTSNPSSTSSISSEISSSSDNNHGMPQQSSSYQPPMPSPTVSQNPHFSPFQPTMTAEEQAQLARLEAQLRGIQPNNGPADGQQQGLGFGAVMPQPQSMRAVESRREVVNKYMRENALLSEAATRLMIREMDDISFN